jgi:hypothetical protein
MVFMARLSSGGVKNTAKPLRASRYALKAYRVHSIVFAGIVDKFNLGNVFAKCSVDSVLQRISHAVVIGGRVTTHSVKACNLKLRGCCISGGHVAGFVDNNHDEAFEW